MVRIKSITDVITNSSSEVIIIHPRGSETPQSILEDLLKVNEEFMEEGSDRYSGDCQDVELLPGRGYKIHKNYTGLNSLLIMDLQKQLNI